MVRKHKLIWLLILLFLAQTPVKAQDDENRLLYILEVPHELGTFSIRYPDLWVSQMQEQGITYATIDNKRVIQNIKPTALVEIAIIGAEALAVPFDTEAENYALTYFAAYREAQLKDGTGVFGNPLPLQLGNETLTLDGALMSFMETAPEQPIVAQTKISLGIAVELGDKTLLIIDFQSSEGEADEFLPLWLNMLDTIMWNDVSLTNDTMREQLALLETPTQLRQIYTDVYINQSPIGIDSSTQYTLTSPSIPIIFSRPRGWIAIETKPDFIRLESPSLPNAHLIVRWLPSEALYLDVHSENAIPAATLLEAVLSIENAEFVGMHSFTWSHYPAAGITYQIPSENRVGAYLGIQVSDGMLEIRVECATENWGSVQITFLALASETVIDGIKFDFQQLVQAANFLKNPTR